MTTLNILKEELEVLGHSDLAEVIATTDFYHWYQTGKNTSELNKAYQEYRTENKVNNNDYYISKMEFAKRYYANYIKPFICNQYGKQYSIKKPKVVDMSKQGNNCHMEDYRVYVKDKGKSKDLDNSSIEKLAKELKVDCLKVVYDTHKSMYYFTTKCYAWDIPDILKNKYVQDVVEA